MSFRFPLGITKKEAGVYRLHGQHQGFDCRWLVSTGYKFLKLLIGGIRRPAVRTRDPSAPFCGFVLERANIEPLVLHDATRCVPSQRDAKGEQKLAAANSTKTMQIPSVRRLNPT
jgi:hypothetical protein